MFTELLNRVVKNTPGVESIAVMGFDGIAVDSYEREADKVDHWQSQAIELSVAASQLIDISKSIDAGAVEEFSVQTERGQTIFRFLNDEFFVAVFLSEKAIPGQAKYLVRLIVPKLLSELE